jgi:hypothetical protein
MCESTQGTKTASIQAVLQRTTADQQLQKEQNHSILALVSSLLGQVGPEGLQLSPVETAGLQIVLDSKLYGQSK